MRPDGGWLTFSSAEPWRSDHSFDVTSSRLHNGAVDNGAVDHGAVDHGAVDHGAVVGTLRRAELQISLGFTSVRIMSRLLGPVTTVKRPIA